MANLIKIHSTLGHRANKTVKTYAKGKPVFIKFDEGVIAEISEDILIEIFQADPSLEVVDKEVEQRLRPESEVSSEVIVTLTKENGSLRGNIVNYKSQIAELIEENENLKAQIIELGAEPVETDVEDKVSRYKLQMMKVEELQDAAKEAGLPSEEYLGLTKKKLVDYLLEKLNVKE